MHGGNSTPEDIKDLPPAPGFFMTVRGLLGGTSFSQKADFNRIFPDEKPEKQKKRGKTDESKGS